MENYEESMLLMRGKTNTLQLNWRKRFQGQSECCPFEDSNIESLKHFMSECEGYIREKYNKHTIYTHNTTHPRTYKGTNLLSFNKQENTKIYMCKSYIEDIWNTRKKKIKERETSQHHEQE